jgi:hypothetical protein
MCKGRRIVALFVGMCELFQASAHVEQKDGKGKEKKNFIHRIKKKKI